MTIKDKSGAYSSLKDEMHEAHLEGYEVLAERNKTSYRFRRLMLNDEAKIYGIATKDMN